MRRIEPNKIEVDMVPMIDIISLLLMFLIVVGDASISAESIQMRLPRADAAVADNVPPIRTEGRIVIQVHARDGKYWAVVNNKDYELVSGGINGTLVEYLQKYIGWALEHKLAKVDPLTGALDLPVKLRIPEAAPMKDVERVITTLSSVKLCNIQYAAMPDEKSGPNR